MFDPLKRIFFFAALTIGFAALLVIVNQIIQLGASISTINQTAGVIFLLLAFGLLIAGLGIPFVLFWRLPARIIPPDDEKSPGYDEFIRKLSFRLNSNPLIQENELTVANEEDVKKALLVLDEHANGIVKTTASRAFYTTAISQNGALDALFILGLQFRMIWDVAHVYSQRPTLKDLGYLYTNVMVTAMVAAQLDEAEFLELIESSMIQGGGSMISMVPGTSLIVNSTLSGASNAFLTLRVGMIARNYCSATTRPDKRFIRNSATRQAASLLTGIVGKGSKDIVQMMTTGTFKRFLGWKK